MAEALGEQVATPTVKVFVGVSGCEISVFHVAFPPVLGSGKDSGARLAIVLECRMMGLIAPLDAVLLMVGTKGCRATLDLNRSTQSAALHRGTGDDILKRA